MVHDQLDRVRRLFTVRDSIDEIWCRDEIAAEGQRVGEDERDAALVEFPGDMTKMTRGLLSPMSYSSPWGRR